MNTPLRTPGVLVRLHLAFWTLYFVAFWGRAFRFDEAGNLVAGHPHLWADWALHFTLGNAMALRELIPASSPLLLGETLAYPFGADLLSALLMRAGLPMVAAFVLPSLLFSVLLVFALFTFLRGLFRSDAVAVIGSWIFLCLGGLGFLAFARDVGAAAHPLLALLEPAHEYTRLGGTSMVLLGVIEAMVVPQRSFTHGFPLALIALGLIHSALGEGAASEPARPRWPTLLLAAMVLGILPLVHAHTFLAVFVILCFWSAGQVLCSRAGTVRQRLAPWALLGAGTALVAVPLIAKFLLGHVGAGFLRWFPGWYARELQVGWAWFWLENWSVTPLLALAGLGLVVWRREGWRDRLGTLSLHLPFLAIFALVNLFLFAPWIFDNTKLLAWAAVGVSGLAARAVVALWSGRPAWLARPAAAALLILATASGAVDAYRVLRVDLHGNVMYTAEALGLAEWARRSTALDSVWLTGDQHNHWLVNLTGRQPVMAYRGWLWSHGYAYQETERDVARMLETADPTLLARYGVDYAVVGPDEKENWHATERAFERFPVVARSGSCTVYRIR